MKLNIDIEIDWIDEDYNLDEAIKHEIIQTISMKITNAISSNIEEKVQEKVNDFITMQLDEKMNSLLEGFLEKPRTITDKYGDVKKRDVTVLDLLKEKCDNFLNEAVDSSGKTGGYHTNQTRLNYILSQKIDHDMKFSIDRAVNTVSAKMKEYIKTQMSEKIGNQIAENIGLEKILKNV